ncbi:MAG TPA: sugar kinase [Tabrizicola sp.]|nr:sugar kinase [Tabrizicola sp.]
MAAACNISAIGECMVELSPEPALGDAPVFRQGFAGDTLNTAWYLRALMPRTCAVRYVTAVGTDALSDQMVAFLADNGIDTGAIARRVDRTVGLYMISVTGGERSFTYWRAQSAARTLADDPARLEQALAGCRLAYLSGITLAILSDPARETLLGVLARFRVGGGLVAFDPNIRPVLWPDRAAMRDWITRGYATCDIAFPTYEDDAALFGDTTPEACGRRISDLGAFEVVVKNGAAPVLLDAGGRQARIPQPTVVKPVDTTAAGDSFNAGWLAARLTGACATSAVTQGHAIAARVIRHRGALMPMDAVRDYATA